MEDNKPIIATIVEILSTTEVLINKGRNDGVKKGTKFKIIAKEVDVKDKGEYIGTYYHGKGEIFAKEIFDKFTYCSTGSVTEWEEEESEPITSSMKPFGFGNKKRKLKSTKPIELNVQEINHYLEEQVNVGDKVVEI
jgi:hypothetical protein